MKAQWLAFCALVAVTAALPAAVSATPTSSSTKSLLPRPAITKFACCLAQRHHRGAADYVIRTSIPLSTTIRAEKKLADRTCVPAESTRRDAKALLKLPEELRPALAEALVRKEFPTFDVSQINAAPPLEYANMAESLWPADSCKKCKPEKLREFEDARTRATKLTAPLVFGECTVRTDPANAHRLLLTEADSREEKAALSSLQLAFEDCVAEGSQFNLSRAAVRDLVALNYYRLARAPRVQQTAGAVK